MPEEPVGDVKVEAFKAMLRAAPLQDWQTWWLSFVDPEKEGGERFLGVSIVQIPDAKYDAKGPNTAISLAAETAAHMGCNPGGEVRGDRIYPDAEIFERLVYYRLLTNKELAELDLI